MDSSKQARIFVADHPAEDGAWAPVSMHGLGSVVHWDDGDRLLTAVLGNAAPDLVFLSDELPGLGGIEICRRLMINPATRTIPVIIMSRRCDADFVASALAVGAADVVHKPLNAELLRTRIRSYLALNKQAQVLSFEAQARAEELERMVETMRCELNERERTMARAEFLFGHDLITGLPNRRQLIELLERARRRAYKDRRPLAVIAIGLQRYEALERMLEREALERLLITAGSRIQQVLRPMDSVARIGDDLFAIVLNHRELGSEEDAARKARDVASRAERALRELMIEGTTRFLEVRAAIAVSPQDGVTGLDLIKHLDQTLALTRGPITGDSSATAQPEMAAAIALELRLRQAIDNDRLIPFYQPKVDARSGRVLGAETLIRWPLRSGEFVRPGEFVPVAEAGGLIPALDDYVLTAVCCQIAEWQDHFAPFRISVNLSALKLHHRGVFDRLRELFATTRARPEHLELEITESALITDFEAASSWLGAVRAMGVTVALDDFGTGYSSLAYLRRLPLDSIKIDQSFVAGLDDERSTVAIVRAMVSMAKALGMQVVAEGVETQRQADILREVGCDALQGFLFSAAVPAKAFEDLLATHRTGNLIDPGELLGEFKLEPVPDLLNLNLDPVPDPLTVPDEIFQELDELRRVVSMRRR